MQIKLLSFMCAFITIVSCNLNSHNFQSKNSDDAQNFQIFFELVDFSAQGFKKFISDTYNIPAYGQLFLPNNFIHMEKFLTYGLESHQPRMYEQQVIRLFANKLKSASYVNPFALTAFLQKMPELLEPFFVIPKHAHIHLLQENINTLLYNSFLQKFSLFKEDPDLFLSSLSQEIVGALNNDQSIAQEMDISIEELRKSLLGFLETALNKLIWSPDDSMNTWHSVKTIAQQLHTLMEHAIITDLDDLNSLYITLIERYSYFVDVMSVDLPISFYHDIKNDIAAQSDLCLFTLEEQDELIVSKKDRLVQVLADAQQHAHDIRCKELALVA